MSAAASHFRAFCSEHSGSGSRFINVAIGVESCSDKNETLPDTSWGPLSAAESRFPLPGQMGLGESESLAADDSGELPLLVTPRKHGDLFTAQLPSELHSDIFLQWRSQIPNLKSEGRLEKLKRKEDIFKLKLEDQLLNISSPQEAALESVDPQQNSEDFLECCFFECPSLLRKDFNALFPEMDFSQSSFTVVTLCQKTLNDMTGWSEGVESEREELLESFFDAAQSMTESLKKAGFWADFIDPSSGKPFMSAYTNATLFETDERFRHLGFEIEDLGCCKVIRHHEWGSHAYVGCVFTTAPLGHPVLDELTIQYQKKQLEDG